MRKTKAALSGALAIGVLAGSTVVVAAHHGTAPVEFTGRLDNEDCSSPAREAVGTTAQTRGEVCTFDVAMSDPRLEGDITATSNVDEYVLERDLRVWSGAYRIENAEGAWQAAPQTVVTLSDGITASTVVFAGQGAYDGLVAVAEFVWDPDSSSWGLRGVIIEGEVPPLPGPGFE